MRGSGLRRSTALAGAGALFVTSSILLPSVAQARQRCNGRTATNVGSPRSETIKGTAGRDVIVALGGDDVVTGFEGDDILCGGPGDDLLIGSFGDDVHLGGSGQDVMLGYSGRDVLIGGEGRWDTAAFWWARAGVKANLGTGRSRGPSEGTDRMRQVEVLSGTRHRDVLIGSGRADRLLSFEGKDTLRGRGGVDWLVGGDGSDLYHGGGAKDMASFYWDRTGVKADLAAGTARGGGSVDRLRSISIMQGSENGTNVLRGDGGRNRLFGTGEGTNDILFGGGGKDELFAFGSPVKAHGGSGNDRIVASGSIVYGDGGDDLIMGETAFGGPGSDRIRAVYTQSAGPGADMIVGSGVGDDGPDTFARGLEYVGGPGRDVMHAQASGHHVFAHGAGVSPPPGSARDIVSYAAAGRSMEVDLDANRAWPRKDPQRHDHFVHPLFVIIGSKFDDVLSGHVGDDVFFAGKGNDTLAGREGDDSLHGGEGNDSADGSWGTDSCPEVEERLLCEDEIQDPPIPRTASPEVLDALLKDFDADIRSARQRAMASLDPRPVSLDRGTEILRSIAGSTGLLEAP